ncbi:hypothetical protein BDZ91DRAFT_750426 [Kalaharituber pfeilii]|nr:hypothetical protein BDZ91DRAFT_750426 [Kalaharituber pfeilii]
MELDAASSIESWKATTDIAICRSCGHTYPHFELRILLQLALSILFLTCLLDNQLFSSPCLPLPLQHLHSHLI